MIDFIKITIENFTGNLDSCVWKSNEVDYKSGKVYENYTLSNGRDIAPHRMKLKRVQGDSKLVIMGSIRKWSTMRDTLADLSSQVFERGIKRIASKLNIPIEEILSARFTHCEIGMNLRTSAACSEVIPLFVRYGRLKKDEEKSVDFQTVYFFGTSKQLKIYDKGKEISDNAQNNKDNNRTRRQDVMSKFKEKGYHFLRVEYTLYFQKSFNQHGLSVIKYVGDLIENYYLLFEFWCKQTINIVLYNHVKPVPEMKKAEFEKALILEMSGFEAAVEEVQKGIDKDARSASVGRSKAYRKLLALIKKYDCTDYNTLTFRRDILRELMYKRRIDSKIDFVKAVKTLLGDYINK